MLSSNFISGGSTGNAGFPEKVKTEMYCGNGRGLRFIQNCRTNGE